MKPSRVAVYIIGAFFGYAVFRAYQQSTGTTTMVDVLGVMTNLLQANVMNTPASNMALSPSGLQSIAEREGFSPTSYVDASGRSIGYGHFIKATDNITEPISQADALALLQSDAQIASDAVRAHVTAPLTQNQFDALTSFAYNVGVGAFKASTLLSLLNSGDVAGAAAQFDRWHTPSSVIARRDSEKAQFLA